MNEETQTLNRYQVSFPDLLTSANNPLQAFPFNPTKEHPFFPLVANEYIGFPLSGFEQLCTTSDIYHREFFAHRQQITSRANKESQEGTRLPQFDWPYTMNARSNPQDVLLRQTAVQELVRNVPLYGAVENFLKKRLFSTDRNKHYYNEEKYLVDFYPQFDFSKLGDILNSLQDIGTLGKNVESYARIEKWVDYAQKHTLYDHLGKEHSKKVARQLLMFYSGRSGHVTYALLKPNVKIAEIADILPTETHSIEIEVGRKRKKEKRFVVAHRFSQDEDATDLILSKSRAQFMTLHGLAAGAYSLPLLMIREQLRHLYIGALWHKELTIAGHPITYPVIKKGATLQVTDALPAHMLLSHDYRFKLPKLYRTSFVTNAPINATLGPNATGKSEMNRTLHHFIFLANNGYAVPAKSMIAGVGNSHFHICNNDRGHGRSEFEDAIAGIKRRLEHVVSGDTIFLDELGDSTNGQTAQIAAENLVAALRKKKCTVFITSHHLEVAQAVSRMGGDIYGIHATKPYQIVPGSLDVKFHAKKTIERVGATQKQFTNAIGKHERTHLEKKVPRELINETKRRENEFDREVF